MIQKLSDQLPIQTAKAIVAIVDPDYQEPNYGCTFNIGINDKEKICGHTSEFDPHGCNGSFFVRDTETHNAKRCPGANASKRQDQLNAFKEFLPERFQAVIAPDHAPRKDQIDAIGSLVKPGKGAWLHGLSGFGKTHLCYRAIYQRLKNSVQLYTWICVKAKALLDSWSNQYSDDKEDRKDSRDLAREIKAVDIIFLDDIDKIGNYTNAREQEMYALIDYLADERKLVYVTSQLSIQSFLSKFPNERLSRESQGRAPIQTRLLELCHEVEVSQPVQGKLL